MQCLTPTHSLPSRAPFTIRFCKLSPCRDPIWRLEMLPCSPEARKTVPLILTEEEEQEHPLFSLWWNEDVVLPIYSPFPIFTKALLCYSMGTDAFSLAHSKQKQSPNCHLWLLRIGNTWNLRTGCTDLQRILFRCFLPPAWISLILSSTPSPLTHVTDALYLTVHREPIHIHFP